MQEKIINKNTIKIIDVYYGLGYDVAVDLLNNSKELIKNLY